MTCNREGKQPRAQKARGCFFVHVLLHSFYYPGSDVHM